MRKHLIQTERILRMLTGFIILPLLYAVLLYQAGIQEYNFSGLMADESFRAAVIPAVLLTVLFTARCLSILYPYIFPVSARYLIWIFTCLAIAALCIPYKEGNAVSSSLHLLSSYCAFGLFCMIMYLSMNSLKEKYIYTAALLLFFLLCIKDGEISGDAELVYASVTSVLLTILTMHK